MSAEISAFSPRTGITYDSWNELLAAESNGYVVVAVPDRKGLAPIVEGPFSDKAEARQRHRRLRRRLTNEYPNMTIRLYLRVLWKEAS